MDYIVSTYMKPSLIFRFPSVRHGVVAWGSLRMMADESLLRSPAPLAMIIAEKKCEGGLPSDNMELRL